MTKLCTVILSLLAFTLFTVGPKMAQGTPLVGRDCPSTLKPDGGANKANPAPNNASATARLLINQFSDLADRVQLANQTGESPFKIELLPKEREVLTDTFNRNVEGALSTIKILEAKNPSLQIAEATKPYGDFLIGLRDQIARFKKSGDYSDSLRLAAEIAYATENIDDIRTALLAKVSVDFEKAERAWRNRPRFDQDWIKGLIEESFVKNISLIPVDIELSIFDFNYLVGSGITPVALSPKGMVADGVYQNPNSLLRHDIAHASTAIPRRFTENERLKWISILNEIDGSGERPRLLLHVLAYYLTHEGNTEAHLFDIKSVADKLHDANLETIMVRLQREYFWGLPQLKTAPATLDELKRSRTSLLNIIFERIILQ
jgi:hypothetical protein